jgi:hypothetical protein
MFDLAIDTKKDDKTTLVSSRILAAHVHNKVRKLRFLKKMVANKMQKFPQPPIKCSWML